MTSFFDQVYRYHNTIPAFIISYQLVVASPTTIWFSSQPSTLKWGEVETEDKEELRGGFAMIALKDRFKYANKILSSVIKLWGWGKSLSTPEAKSPKQSICMLQNKIWGGDLGVGSGAVGPLGFLNIVQIK